MVLTARVIDLRASMCIDDSRDFSLDYTLFPKCFVEFYKVGSLSKQKIGSELNRDLVCQFQLTGENGLSFGVDNLMISDVLFKSEMIDCIRAMFRIALKISGNDYVTLGFSLSMEDCNTLVSILDNFPLESNEKLDYLVQCTGSFIVNYSMS